MVKTRVTYDETILLRDVTIVLVKLKFVSVIGMSQMWLEWRKRNYDSYFE